MQPLFLLIDKYTTMAKLLRSGILLLLVLCTAVSSVFAQLYFPPKDSDDWETTAPESLNWCSDSINALYDFLDEKNSKAFIVLKDGKIVLEKYFNDLGPDSFWYWASAGKALRATLLGIAQREGALSLDDKVSDHIDTGWTNCCLDKENLVQVRHLLTMSSGLDDRVADPYCTDDTCLRYLANAGTRWAYHNAPYNLTRDVLESATGENLNRFTRTRILNLTGMDGFWLPSGYNTIFWSTARSMARFGLMTLNGGDWGVQPVLADTNYFKAMTTRSQEINKSYGYLWWLNGQETHMLPGTQVVFNGSIVPSAPDDMYAGLGANDQKVYVVPSQNMVVVRLGNDAGQSMFALSSFDNDLWRRIADLECKPGHVTNNPIPGIKIYPQPAERILNIEISGNPDFEGRILDMNGREVLNFSQRKVDLSSLASGSYLLNCETDNHVFHQRIFVCK